MQRAAVIAKASCACCCIGAGGVLMLLTMAIAQGRPLLLVLLLRLMMMCESALASQCRRLRQATAMCSAPGIGLGPHAVSAARGQERFVISRDHGWAQRREELALPLTLPLTLALSLALSVAVAARHVRAVVANGECVGRTATCRRDKACTRRRRGGYVREGRKALVESRVIVPRRRHGHLAMGLGTRRRPTAWPCRRSLLLRPHTLLLLCRLLVML